MNFHDLFSYDPETGILTWKVSRSNCVKVGQEVNGIDRRPGQGYKRTFLNGKTYFVHRIIYEMMTGNRRETANRNLPKGVYFHKGEGRYIAKLNRRTLGRFRVVEDAKAAYDAAAVDRYGEFARS
jgi:hypothetical protein